MSEQELYDKAFAQMGSAPLEEYEAQPLRGQGGPGRGQGRKPGKPNPHGGRKPKKKRLCIDGEWWLGHYRIMQTNDTDTITIVSVE